jgi:hypothetical protein
MCDNHAKTGKISAGVFQFVCFLERKLVTLSVGQNSPLGACVGIIGNNKINTYQGNV